MSKNKAFTLIELLVVIAIIALLLAVIAPALRIAKEQGRRVVCAAHQKGVGLAVSVYLENNDGKFFSVANNGMWDNPNTGEEYPPTHSWAYWGIAYAQYTADRQIFKCPSAKIVDCWVAPGEQFSGRSAQDVLKYFQYCHYGLNSYLSGKKVTEFKLLSSVIFAQDHIEQLLDGINSDMFCIGPTAGINLTQWRYSLAPWYPSAVQECFRHNRTSYTAGAGLSNSVWLDGHVSTIKQTTGEDVPVRWYTGKSN